MLRILLIRHGQTDMMGHVLYGRMPGVHISSQGRSDCQALGQHLRTKFAIDAIVSSPLERALETVEAMQIPSSVPTIVDQEWIELDYGEWMGRNLAEVRELESWQHFNRARSTGVPPGGESMMQVQARAWRAVERILSRGNEGNYAVVSHGDVIRSLLVLLLGMPLDHIHRFEISPASWSEVRFDERYPRVVCINNGIHISA